MKRMLPAYRRDPSLLERATGARGGRLVPRGELGKVGTSTLTQRILARAGV